MTRWEYIPVILMAVLMSLLIVYPHVRESREAWEAQIRMNEVFIQAMENSAAMDAELFEIIKLISKK